MSKILISDSSLSLICVCKSKELILYKRNLASQGDKFIHTKNKYKIRIKNKVNKK